MNIKKSLIFIITAVICLSLISIKAFAAGKKRSISLNTTNIELKIGENSIRGIAPSFNDERGAKPLRILVGDCIPD